LPTEVPCLALAKEFRKFVDAIHTSSPNTLFSKLVSFTTQIYISLVERNKNLSLASETKEINKYRLALTNTSVPVLM
jgi:hypothetical protein